MAAPDDDKLRAIRAANARLNEAMRVMFVRWGEARIALPEDQAAAKDAVEKAEAEFQAARVALEALERAPTAPRLDLRALRASLERMARALERGQAEPDAIFHAQGTPELGSMHWEHEVAAAELDVWVLADEKGRVMAKLTHRGDEPRWTSAVFDEATGEMR